MGNPSPGSSCVRTVSVYNQPPRPTQPLWVGRMSTGDGTTTAGEENGEFSRPCCLSVKSAGSTGRRRVVYYGFNPRWLKVKGCNGESFQNLFSFSSSFFFFFSNFNYVILTSVAASVFAGHDRSLIDR